MSYDPDLDPVLAAMREDQAKLDARVATLENAFAPTDVTAPLAALDARVTMLDARVTALANAPAPVDLAPQLDALVARVVALEKGGTTPVAPPAVTPPAATVPIWQKPGVKRSRITAPKEMRVKPGQREIYIPVTADHTNFASFYVFISSFRNMTGGGVNVGTEAQQAAMAKQYGIYRWSPDDDLTHYVRMTLTRDFKAGQFFEVNLTAKNLGDSLKGLSIKLIFDDEAVEADRPPQFHRPLYRLDLSKAKRANVFDPAAVKWSDSGFGPDGKPVWRARLSHGYAQAGNGETGAYLNEDKFPGVAQNPISYDAGENAVRLHTVAFPMDKRAEVANTLYRHQAAMIQGQTLPDVCGADGLWRMVAKIPIRRFSWPAFWLGGLGSQGAQGGWTAWPPEFDILEKFNYVYGGADTPFTSTFGQHYGNAGSNNRAGASGGEVELNQWLREDKPLDEEYHSWALAIDYADDPMKCRATFFVDDVEVGTMILLARHQDMKTRMPLYPMMNVAVREPSGNYTPEQYNTDDGRGRTGDMLIRDMGYYPSGYAFLPVG